jgi:DNA-binding transcriptional LysR family regulator
MDRMVPTLPGCVTRCQQISRLFSLSDSNVNLIEDNFDVAVRMERLQDSSLRRRKLCDLQRVVAASPRYIEKRGQPLALP